MSTPIFQQSSSIFDVSASINSGIIPLQSDPSGPQITGVDRATNMLLPDSPTTAQLRNFPEELYDLRENSRLVRLMKVLLGDAGAGQLRKRTLVTRLEAALSGANFFDLDRFYGAVFGVLRNPGERLAISPMDDVATPDEWDAIRTADASFRERVASLARAVVMGGSVAGLSMAAEALVQAPVDIYESWQLLDAYGAITSSAPSTWDDMEGLYPTWSAFGSTSTWNAVEGTVQVGRTNTLTRSEIIIRPRKGYSDPGTFSDQPLDEIAMVRVLQKLRPAGTIITVDPDMGDPHVPADISYLHADSEYWEVVQKVQPKPTLVGVITSLYPLSAQQRADGVPETGVRVLPRPPFSGTQGRSWSYNTAISSVTSYSFMPSSDDLDDLDQGDLSSGSNDQIVAFRDGSQKTFSARLGVLSAQQTLAAQSVSDGTLVAHPYTGDRKAITGHD